MEITIITGTKLRHKYFVNLLKKVSKKLNVIQEIPDFSKKIESKSNESKKHIVSYYSKLKLIEKKRIFFHSRSDFSPVCHVCLNVRFVEEIMMLFMTEVN